MEKIEKVKKSYGKEVRITYKNLIALYQTAFHVKKSSNVSLQLCKTLCNVKRSGLMSLYKLFYSKLLHVFQYLHLLKQYNALYKYTQGILGDCPYILYHR